MREEFYWKCWEFQLFQPRNDERDCERPFRQPVAFGTRPSIIKISGCCFTSQNSRNVIYSYPLWWRYMLCYINDVLFLCFRRICYDSVHLDFSAAWWVSIGNNLSSWSSNCVSRFRCSVFDLAYVYECSGGTVLEDSGIGSAACQRLPFQWNPE